MAEGKKYAKVRGRKGYAKRRDMGEIKAGSMAKRMQGEVAGKRHGTWVRIMRGEQASRKPIFFKSI